MRYKESDLHLDLYSSLTSVSNLNLLTLLLGNVLVSQNLHGCDRQKGTDQ